MGAKISKKDKEFLQKSASKRAKQDMAKKQQEQKSKQNAKTPVHQLAKQSSQPTKLGSKSTAKQEKARQAMLNSAHKAAVNNTRRTRNYDNDSPAALEIKKKNYAAIQEAKKTVHSGATKKQQEFMEQSAKHRIEAENYAKENKDVSKVDAFRQIYGRSDVKQTAPLSTNGKSAHDIMLNSAHNAAVDAIKQSGNRNGSAAAKDAFTSFSDKSLAEKLGTMMQIRPAWHDPSNTTQAKSQSGALHQINAKIMEDINNELRESMRKQYGNVYDWDTYEPITYNQHTGEYTLNYTGTAQQNDDGTWTYSGGKTLTQAETQGSTSPLKHPTYQNTGVSTKNAMQAGAISDTAGQNEWLSRQSDAKIQSILEERESAQATRERTEQLKQSYEQSTGKKWDDKSGIGKGLYRAKAAVSSGLYSANQSLAKTVDFLFCPKLIFGEDNAFSKWLDDWYGNDSKNAQAFQNQYELAYNTAGSAGRLGMWTTRLVAENIPQSLVAIGTAGASTVPELAADGGYTLLNAMESVIKNPSFWTSFAQIAGTSYEDAKDNGADEVTAIAYAYTTSFLQSLIEIDGGLETMNTQAAAESLNELFRRTVSVAIQEGGEEVQQDIVDNLLQLSMYEPDKTIFSTTDQRALFNPVRTAENFAGGAIVGGLMGGGQQALSYAANRAYRAANAQTNTNTQESIENETTEHTAQPETAVSEREVNPPEPVQHKETEPTAQTEKQSEADKAVNEAKKKVSDAAESTVKEKGEQVVHAASETLQGDGEAVLRTLNSAGTETYIRADMNEADATEKAAFAAAYASGLQSAESIAKTQNIEHASEILGDTLASEAYEAGVQDRAAVHTSTYADAEVMAQAFDAEGRTAFEEYRQTQSAQNDPDAYFEAFTRYYNAGLTDNLAEVDTSTWAKYISQEAAAAAFEAGTQDAAQRVETQHEIEISTNGGLAETYAELDASTRENLDYLGKSLGVRIELADTIENGSKNASLEGSVIRVARDAQGSTINEIARVYTAHEISHRMQEFSPKQWKSFRDYVLKQLSDHNADKAEQLISEKMDEYTESGRTLTRQEALDEIAAEYAQNLLTDKQSIETFIASRPKAAKGFFQKLKNAIRALKKKLTGKTAAEKRFLRELSTAQKLWTECFADAAQKANGAAQKAQTDTATRYAAKKKAANDGSRMTENEIKTVQSLERKSLNDLTGEEMEKLAPIAERYYKTMGEKSPFFRAWFGDWRVNDQTAVQVATQKGSTRGLQHNTDTKWDIGISRMVFNETTAHRGKFNTSAVPYLDYINDIIKNAVLLDTYTIGKTKSPNSLLMHNFYALANIHGYPELLKLYVEEMYNPSGTATLKRAYQLQNIESQQLEVTGSTNNRLAVSSTADIYTVADLFQTVKQRDKKFSPKAASQIVNEDGSPKIMYHGTASDFWEFSMRRSNDLTGRRLGLGAGSNKIYLTEYEMSARMAADGANSRKSGGNPHVLGLYVSAQKVMNRTQYNSMLEEQYAKYPNAVPFSENYDYQQRDKAIRAVDKKIRSEGYDAVWDRDSGELFVYNPNQVKSATENTGVFSRSNNDIRYSAKERTAQSYESEIERLKKQRDEAKRQIKLSRYQEVTPAGIEKMARNLLSEYHSAADTTELTESLQTLYEILHKRPELIDTERAYGFAETIAEQIVDDATIMDTEMSETYADLLSDLKRQAISVPAENRNDLSDTWSSFKKQHRRYVQMTNSGTPVDVRYMELNEQYPELFPAEITNPAEQMELIVETARTFAPVERSFSEDEYSHAVDEIAQNVINQFKETASLSPTYADRQKMRFDALKESTRKQITELKQQQKKALDDLRAEMIRSGENYRQDSLLQQKESYETKIAEIQQKIADLKQTNREQRLADDMHYGRKMAEQKRIAQEKLAEERQRSREKARTAVAQSDARRAAAAQIRQAKQMNVQENSDMQEHKHLPETMDMVGKYGAIEPGENPVRAVTLPQSTDGQTRVRRFYRTTAEAGQTSDRMVTELEQEVLNNAAASYIVQSNAESITKAKQRISAGNEMAQWEAVVNGNHMPKAADIAMGELLLDRALKQNDTETALKLTEQLAYIGTKAGQVVQAMRMLKQLSGVSQIHYVNRSVQDMQRRLNSRYGDHAPKLTIPSELQAELMRAQTEEQKYAAQEAIFQAVADQIPSTLSDKWHAWRYFAMLANPRTHIRNLVGNAVFMPAIILKNVQGVIIESVVSRTVSKDMERTKSVSSLLPSEQRALAKSLAKKTFSSVEDEIRGGGKYNAADQIRDKQTIFKSKMGRMLEKAMDLNTDALDKEDVFFQKIQYRNALTSYILSNGYTETDLFTEDGNPTAAMNKAMAYAVKEAQRATYHDASALANSLQQFSRSGRVQHLLVEGLMPFKKTPINILKRAMEYSPVGLVHTLAVKSKALANGSITPAEYIDSLSQGLTGTEVLALGVFMAAHGLLRSSGGDDEDKNMYEKYALGEQNYAVVFGNNSYTIDFAAPMVMPLMVGAELQATLSGKGLTLSEILNALSLIGEPFVSLSMMDSLQSTLNSISNSEQKVSAAVGTIAGSYFSQGVPTFMGQIARIGQENAKTVFTENPDTWIPIAAQAAVYKARNKIPELHIPGKFGKWFDEHCTIAAGADLVDDWGNLQSNGNIFFRMFSNLVSPGYYKRIQKSAIDEELLRLYNTYGEDAKAILPSYMSKKFKVYTDSGETETKQLRRDEWTQYKLVYGETAYKVIEDLMRTEAYKSASDADKIAMISKMHQYANGYAQLSVDNDAACSGWIRNLMKAGVSPAKWLADTYQPTSEDFQNGTKQVKLYDDVSSAAMGSSVYRSADDTNKVKILDDVSSYVKQITMLENGASEDKIDKWVIKARDCGVDIGTAIAARRIINSIERDDNNRAEELQRQWIASTNLTAEDKHKIDKAFVSEWRMIKTESDVYYDDTARFKITQMSESAQKKWEMAKSDGWGNDDVDKFIGLYKIVSGKGKKDEKQTAAAEAGYSTSDFNRVWKWYHTREE